jgi:hypothetical protein
MTRMNLLHTIGLMTRAEHEAVKLQAAADKQLIEKLTATARRLHNLLECRDAEIAASLRALQEKDIKHG